MQRTLLLIKVAKNKQINKMVALLRVKFKVYVIILKNNLVLRSR